MDEIPTVREYSRPSRHWLPCVVLLTGCHWALPLAPEGADGRAADLPRLDAAVPGSDVPDTGRESLPPDGATLVPTTLGCPDGGCCVEADPWANPHCDDPICQAPKDCDGLPDDRDPWPLDCNRAVVAAPFFDDTLPWFAHAYCDSQVRGECGAMAFYLATQYTLWAWIRGSLGVAIDPKDLVEVRLLPVVGDRWELGVLVPGNGVPANECTPWQFVPEHWRKCSLKRDGNVWQLKNDVAGKILTTSDFTPPANGALVLQSWVEGGLHRCRVYAGPALVGSVELQLGDPLLTGNTVMLQVYNEHTSQPAEVRVDYLRVFKRK